MIAYDLSLCIKFRQREGVAKGRARVKLKKAFER